MTQKALFVDTETTGLHTHKGHEAWEFGILEAADVTNLDDVTPFTFRVYPDLSCADPSAIQVNRFYERTRHMDPPHPEGNGTDPTGERWSAPLPLAATLAAMFENALVVANNPGFDVEMVEWLLIRTRHVMAPFHRKVNVVDLGLGALAMERRMRTDPDDPRIAVIDDALRMPHSSSKVMAALGIEKSHEHTALADAYDVLKVYRKVMEV